MLDTLHPGGVLGLAVSGGSDSTALLHLAADWARRAGVSLRVATVDHGLRDGSAAEAAAVLAAAVALGLPAERLDWRDWDGRGNLQSAARAARRRLLTDWARTHGLAAVAMGHTQDDQAETVLLRLLRGSGVDGLSAMRPSLMIDGVVWIRPLLGVSRVTLRAWLASQGIGWVDDPSNADPRFDRVRVREAMGALGIDAAGLAATAARLADARVVLDDAAEALAARAATIGPCGTVHLALDPLRKARAETRMRLLARSFAAVAGNPYPPRRASLDAWWASLSAAGSLHGCLMRKRGASCWIAREPAAPVRETAPWDGRWHLEIDAAGTVGALGESGLRALEAAARAGRWQASPAWASEPRAARSTTPALWQEGRLACAPIAAYGEGLSVTWAGEVPGARHQR